MDAIRPLYPKLSPGEFCIVDDYYKVPACKRAIDDYRAEQGITSRSRRSMTWGTSGSDGRAVFDSPGIRSNGMPAVHAHTGVGEQYLLCEGEFVGLVVPPRR
jgi:hypothetical protein